MHALVIHFWYSITVFHIYWCMAIAINTQSKKYKTFSFQLEASSELPLPFLCLQSDVLHFIL
jgi:hypothetical protein